MDLKTFTPMALFSSETEKLQFCTTFWLLSTRCKLFKVLLLDTTFTYQSSRPIIDAFVALFISSEHCFLFAVREAVQKRTKALT